MASADALEERGRRHVDTDWEGVAIPLGASLGIANARFRVGGGVDAPTVWRSVFPPGCRISPHRHRCDYAEIVLSGSQQVGRTWYHEGDIRIVPAGTVYGPLVAGPDGATVLVVMAGGDDEALPPREGQTVTVAVGDRTVAPGTSPD